MIKKPTVLILGAGSAVSYGFPTGPELKNQICQPNQIARLANLAEKLSFTHDELRRLEDKLKKGSAKSIDAFLEKNPELIHVGKCAIAFALIQFERESRLLPPEAPKLDWYFEIGVNLLSEGWKRLNENKLTIITFNYDRSLEYRLALMIAADSNLDISTALGVVSALEIIHCHGTLGDLLSGKPEYRAYDPDPNPMAIATAAKSIQIIHEVKPGSAFNRAKASLKQAQRIYFLGFGYHPLNMERLGITAPGQFPWSNATSLFVNCAGGSERQLSWLKETYGLSPQDYSRYYGLGAESAIIHHLDLT